MVFKMNINVWKQIQIYLINHTGSFQIKFLIRQTQTNLEIVWLYSLTFDYMCKQVPPKQNSTNSKNDVDQYGHW